jgi:hypothetical protein
VINHLGGAKRKGRCDHTPRRAALVTEIYSRSGANAGDVRKRLPSKSAVASVDVDRGRGANRLRTRQRDGQSDDAEEPSAILAASRQPSTRQQPRLVSLSHGVLQKAD